MIAKGKDLQDASTIESLQQNLRSLKINMRSFSERLEHLRERIEGAARLHHLIAIQVKDHEVHQEMQRLADKLCIISLSERCKETIKKLTNENCIVTSTPNNKISCWQDQLPPLVEEPQERHKNHTLRSNTIEEDEEDHSKMADSGLGGCDRCEGNEKMTRACSCQSFDDATNTCGKRYFSQFWMI